MTMMTSLGMMMTKMTSHSIPNQEQHHSHAHQQGLRKALLEVLLEPRQVPLVGLQVQKVGPHVVHPGQKAVLLEALLEPSQVHHVALLEQRRVHHADLLEVLQAVRKEHLNLYL
jgi:hypothetical protein